MVKVGDIVQERLQFESRSTRLYKGKVIYVHPKRRFYRAEFQLQRGKVTEAFLIKRYTWTDQDEADERHKRPHLAELNRRRKDDGIN